MPGHHKETYITVWVNLQLKNGLLFSGFMQPENNSYCSDYECHREGQGREFRDGNLVILTLPVP